jgi:hypothetical protein
MISIYRSVSYPPHALHRITLSALARIQNSFDDFVRPVKNRLRNIQTELVGSLEIDHELKLLWLLNRDVGWFCAF